jgi:hypothetical protein
MSNLNVYLQISKKAAKFFTDISQILEQQVNGGGYDETEEPTNDKPQSLADLQTVYNFLTSVNNQSQDNSRGHAREEAKAQPVATVYVKPKKKKRNPNEPKRPLSTYLKFFADYHGQIKIDNPELNQPEIAKIIGVKWQCLPKPEKDRYKATYDSEMVEYNRSMEEYKNTHIGSQEVPNLSTLKIDENVRKVEHDQKPDVKMTNHTTSPAKQIEQIKLNVGQGIDTNAYQYAANEPTSEQNTYANAYQDGTNLPAVGLSSTQTMMDQLNNISVTLPFDLIYYSNVDITIPNQRILFMISLY